MFCNIYYDPNKQGQKYLSPVQLRRDGNHWEDEQQHDPAPVQTCRTDGYYLDFHSLAWGHEAGAQVLLTHERKRVTTLQGRGYDTTLRQSLR